MKIKTSELTGAALDWAVAKCEGHLELQPYLGKMIPRVVIDPEFWAEDGKPMVRLNPCPQTYYNPEYAPSKDWSQGGPIIERERIGVTPFTVQVGDDAGNREWFANHESQGDFFDGPTPLIAAMRCYVASKLGDEVEVPDELHGA